LQRSALSVNEESVKCASTTTGNIAMNQFPQNEWTLLNWQSTSAVQNDTESEKEKEKEGK